MLEDNPTGIEIPFDDNTRLVAVLSTGLVGVLLAFLTGPSGIVGAGFGSKFAIDESENVMTDPPRLQPALPPPPRSSLWLADMPAAMAF